ncbi:MAG TPA: DUF2892 domain-containing protein [Burkholderiaceae bacterium]|jgi:uncharacterized membrane protein|nr:DUF2892 domain-containing protein [Burkholderiaceae bacterium]
MKENVGTADRALRFVVGPALMLAGYQAFGGRSGHAGGLAAIVAGALVIESAITRVCPLNAALGIDTRERDDIGDGSAQADEAALRVEEAAVRSADAMM